MAAKKIRARTKKTRPTRLVNTRYWMAVGTLTAYGAVGSSLSLAGDAVHGKENGPPSPAANEAAVLRKFDIPAGPLNTVVSAFEQVAQLHVLIPDDRIGSIASPGVRGRLSSREALGKLLDATGVDSTYTGADTVQLHLRESRTTVDVNSTAPTVSNSLPKYQVPLLDTPQTVNTVSRQTMEQQSNTTLRDALRNVAGISLAAGEGGAQGDNLTIRGFTARNDLFIDGMRDFGSYYRDPFNIDEVQVLQGPSSVTFGRGSTGGIVNQASKQPQLNRFVSGDFDFGTDETRRGVVDVSLPIPKLGEGASFRMSAMGNIGNVAGRDVAEVRRDGIAPSLALGLGTPTRLIFSYFHQNADDNPDYGIPWLFDGAAPVNRKNYYGFRNGNYLRTYDDIGTVRAEHDFSSSLTLRNQVRYANYIRDAQITEAQVLSPSLTTPLSQLSINRNQIAVNSQETFLDDQLDLTAHFETGPLRHTFVSGIEGGKERSDPTRPRWTGVPTTSLLNPDPDQAFAGTSTINTQVNDTAVSLSTYATDTVAVGKKVQVSGGVRFDRFDNTYTQGIKPASAFERLDQKATWRAAIVYKPVRNGSLYFDSGTSFNPSAETLALSAGTVNLPPETNKTYEFGTKWEFNRGRLSTNATWFRTVKENAREADPTNSLLYVLAGTQRVSGTEVDVRGRVTNHWDVLTSYAYLDSHVVGSQFFPLSVGAQLANVPRHTYNFWSNYHLPHHVDLGLGTNYESSRTASSTAPLDPITQRERRVPGYWVFNAMASYPLTEHISLQANVYNLANRYYYDQLHPAHIVPGVGRFALMGVRFKF